MMDQFDPLILPSIIGAESPHVSPEQKIKEKKLVSGAKEMDKLISAE